jgi:hypothetical protein
VAPGGGWHGSRRGQQQQQRQRVACRRCGDATCATRPRHPTAWHGDAPSTPRAASAGAAHAPVIATVSFSVAAWLTMLTARRRGWRPALLVAGTNGRTPPAAPRRGAPLSGRMTRALLPPGEALLRPAHLGATLEAACCADACRHCMLAPRDLVVSGCVVRCGGV